jgi:hypothetical protein
MKKASLYIVVLSVFFGAVYVHSTRAFSSYITQCKQSDNKARCYTDRIDEILATKGLSSAFDFLAAAYTADSDFARFCHANTHDLGRSAYLQFRSSEAVELSTKTSYCGYGFYHGFMEEMLVQTDDAEEAKIFCAYVGKEVPYPPAYAEGACYHGIGHGVTDGYDVEASGDAYALTVPGLKLCKAVASSNQEWQERCYSGVFNSIAILYRRPEFTLTTDNPFTLCSAQYVPREKKSCYSQMNTLAMFMAKGDVSQAVAYTKDISDIPYRGYAIEGIMGFYVQVLKTQKKRGLI